MMARPYMGYKLHKYGDELDADAYVTAIDDLGYLFFKDSTSGLSDEEEVLFRRLIELTDAYERKAGW